MQSVFVARSFASVSFRWCIISFHTWYVRVTKKVLVKIEGKGTTTDCALALLRSRIFFYSSSSEETKYTFIWGIKSYSIKNSKKEYSITWHHHTLNKKRTGLIFYKDNIKQREKKDFFIPSLLFVLFDPQSHSLTFQVFDWSPDFHIYFLDLHLDDM